MRYTFLFIMTVLAATAFAGDLTVTNSNGVTVELRNNVFGEPFAAVKDKSGKNFPEIASLANEVVAYHSLHCEKSGYKKWINDKLGGCKWIGFQPAEAVLVPYNTIVPKGKDTTDVLVVRGKVSGQDGTKTFIVPVEAFIEMLKKGESLGFPQKGAIQQPGEGHYIDFREPQLDALLMQLFNPLKATGEGKLPQNCARSAP